MRFIAYIYLCIYVHSLTKQNLQTLRRTVDRINMRPPMRPGRVASFARCFVVFWSRVSYTPDKDWLTACRAHVRLWTGEKFTADGELRTLSEYVSDVDQISSRKSEEETRPYTYRRYKTLLSLYMKRDILTSVMERFARW